MFNLWSKVRAASAAAAFLVAGVLAVVGPAAPAHADENGSEWCFLSTGSITVLAGSTVAPPSVPYGTNLTVSWTVIPACPDLAVYMNGPGFNGTEYVLWGPRTNVWATPPNGSQTLSWTLTVIGMDASMPTPYVLDVETRTVT